MMDKITLNNMVFFGYHGTLEEEQEVGGRYEVDADLIGDFTQASMTDKLGDAVNYQSVFALVKQKVEDSKYHLIEKLAADVADSILEKYDLEEVSIRLRKRNVPIGGVIDYVEIELTRSRS